MAEAQDQAEAELLEIVLFVPADFHLVDSTVRRLLEEARELGRLTSKSLIEIETALRETLAQTMYRSEPVENETVRVVISFDKAGGWSVAVRDIEYGLSPSGRNGPTLKQRLYAANGRSILLLRQLVDEVHFTSNGREICLHKKAG